MVNGRALDYFEEEYNEQVVCELLNHPGFGLHCLKCVWL